MKIISKKIRESARGEVCALRIPGVCSFNPETTVLAHLPVGQRGMGIKNPDLFAVYACHACHEVLDARAHGYIDGWDVLRALAETQMKLVEKGLLKVEGVRA